MMLPTRVLHAELGVPWIAYRGLGGDLGQIAGVGILPVGLRGALRHLLHALLETRGIAGRIRREFRLRNSAAGFGFELVAADDLRSEEHTSELQSLRHLVCRLL